METQIRSFRNLNTWQKGIDLVKKIYKETKDFPKEEIYGLTSQLSPERNPFPLPLHGIDRVI